jgi:hypothetical protein
MRSSERGGWIVGLVLIAVGGVFLLQNAGVPVLVGNWWALFILIPAVAAFTAAWSLYQQDGHFTPRVVGLISGGLVPLTIALIFLFNASFGSAWPILLVVLGAGLVLRGGIADSAEKPKEVSS